MKVSLSDPRFTPFRERIVAFYQWKWNQECAWDGSESNQLARLLRSCPNLDVNTFSRWLYNYGLSDDIPPGERPRKFLPRIHDYSVTKLDRFHRDPSKGNGEKSNAKPDRFREAIERSREDDRQDEGVQQFQAGSGSRISEGIQAHDRGVRGNQSQPCFKFGN